jgi:Tfp pilus assembly protein PilX
MITIHAARRQRGATLVVSLIMLLMITVIVASAFTMGGTNLQAVGNMQFRDEATAAANYAIEQMMTGFTTAVPTAHTYSVDINNDGTADYTVSVVPTCIKSDAVSSGSNVGKQSGVELVALTNTASIDGYRTTWDIQATVTDTTGTGSSVVIHQGVRKMLTSDCS